MASLLLDPFMQVLDANGKPVSNAKITIRDGGTTDEANCYSEIGLSTLLAQPIRTNSAGRLINASNARIGVYVNGGQTYKVTITTSADAAVDELDLIPGDISDNGGTLAVANGGTGSGTAAGARTNLDAASQSSVDSLANSVAAVQAGIDGLPGGTFGDLAGKDTVAVTDLATGFGAVVLQSTRVDFTTSVVQCNSSIPADNTIPQNTEGVEVLTGSFTPKSASSFFVIEVGVQGTQSGSSNRFVGMALFKDSGTDAIASSFTDAHVDNSGAGYQQLHLRHRLNSSSTTAITFAVRVGTSGSSFYVNGDGSGTRLLGGVSVAYLDITEYLTV